MKNSIYLSTAGEKNIRFHRNLASVIRYLNIQYEHNIQILQPFDVKVSRVQAAWSYISCKLIQSNAFYTDSWEFVEWITPKALTYCRTKPRSACSARVRSRQTSSWLFLLSVSFEKTKLINIYIPKSVVKLSSFSTLCRRKTHSAPPISFSFMESSMLGEMRHFTHFLAKFGVPSLRPVSVMVCKQKKSLDILGKYNWKKLS